jgi:hypothetical protein
MPMPLDVERIVADPMNQGRTVIRGHIDTPGFPGVGLVAGTPATVELGTAQTSHIGLLGVNYDGTLATDVSATGDVGRVVAKSAYIRGNLEIDLLPGTYGSTTVYNDVVTAPNLGRVAERPSSALPPMRQGSRR